MAAAETYDHIVIGAGSAGCVVANRLSADPDRKVLLLEAGGKDSHPLVRLPMLMGKLMHSGNKPAASKKAMKQQSTTQKPQSKKKAGKK